MKKIVLIVLFGVMCGTSYAQIAWGLRAGLCYSTAEDESGQLSGKPSLEIGPTVYYSLKENIYFNSGLTFSIKNFEGQRGIASLTGFFIDLPVFAGYAFHIGKLDLYAQAGPYIGVKTLEIFDYKGEGHEEKDLLKSFNYGLGAAAGINIYKFKIEMGTQYGLANMSKIGGELTIGSVFAGVSYIF
jgi:hypothetical protein